MLSRRLVGIYNPIACWHLRLLMQPALGLCLDSGTTQHRHTPRYSDSGGRSILAFLTDSLVGGFDAPVLRGSGASAPVFTGPEGRRRVRSHMRRLRPPWRRP